MASDSIARTIGPWPHVLWIVPRFVVGFVFVFLYVPVLRNIFSVGSTAWAPPFPLFVGFFDAITHDSGYLYSLVVISIISGFVAMDFVVFWNKILRRFTIWVGGERLYDFFRHRERAPTVDHDSLIPLQLDTRFRVWLLATDRGTKAQYLDANGFYKTLLFYYKHGFLLFIQLWIVYGVLSFVNFVYAGLMAQTNALAVSLEFFEFVAILVLAFALYYLSRQQAISSARMTDKTWRDLYDWFKESTEKGSRRA